MKTSFVTLRLTLAVVIGLNLWFGYLYFFSPQEIADYLLLGQFDSVHQYFAMNTGASLFVLGLGALLAFFRPLKYGTLIILIILSYFAYFLLDVILAARGALPIKRLLPEMIFYLIVCTALIRYYPIHDKKKEKKEKEPEPEPEKIEEMPIIEEPEELNQSENS